MREGLVEVVLRLLGLGGRRRGVGQQRVFVGALTKMAIAGAAVLLGEGSLTECVLFGSCG